MTPISGSEVTH